MDRLCLKTANKNPRLSSNTFTAVLREQECEFVRYLKPKERHMYLDGQW